MSFETRQLTVRYRRDGPPALHGLDLEVRPGSLHAVLGPNGSGKSTLVRALLGAVAPAAGEARFEGRRVGEWSRRALARRVGAVSQHETTAFPLSARELVEMGRYPHLGPMRPMGEADHEAVRAALDRCDAGALAERRVDTLSGGEFQRVRIARALAQEPSALVLDEPTASLDVRHEMAILRLLRDAADAGLTVLLVTHHLNLAARFADRITLLDRGRPAAQGPVAEVFRAEILEAVYGWPLAVRPDPVVGTPAVTPLDPPPASDGDGPDQDSIKDTYEA